MASVTYIVSRHQDGAFTAGVRYDSETLLITHVGGESTSDRGGRVEIAEPATKARYSRAVSARRSGWQDISGLGLHMARDKETGSVWLPFAFQSGS